MSIVTEHLNQNILWKFDAIIICILLYSVQRKSLLHYIRFND